MNRLNTRKNARFLTRGIIMRILSSAWALLLLGLLGVATAEKRDHVSLAARAPAKVSMGWFPYWTTDKFPVSSINWKLYTHMSFAFMYVKISSSEGCH